MNTAEYWNGKERLDYLPFRERQGRIVIQLNQSKLRVSYT